MIKVIVWPGHPSEARQFGRHYVQMDAIQLAGR
jgi:hypothetical protein